MSGNKQNGVFGRKALVVAIAVGAAVSASAWASDLSIYGVGDLSTDSINTGAQSSDYIHSNSSRLGFKGSDDLGNGLTVFFQFESGMDITGNGTGDGNGGANSNGQIFTRARDSFVGVRGAFGTALVGRLDGLNQWVYDYNLFADQVGDLGNIWGGDGLPGRLDHAAQYITPDFRGFTLGVTYAPNQGTSNSSNTVVKANYVIGGLKLGAGYGKFGNGVALSDQKATALTASYDMGAFNVGGGWQRETDIGGKSGADRNKYTLGAAVKVGDRGTVKVQYARAGDLSNTSHTGANQWAVGYDYAWNRSTTLYVAYAKTNNSAGESYSAFDWGHGNQGVPAIIVGNSPSAISVGFTYTFDYGLLKR